jgi:hypothetical protein
MKWTKERLEPAVRGSTSYGQVIDKLGLKRSGGTQANLVRRIRQYGLDTSHFLGQAHGKGKQAQHRLHFSEVLVYNRGWNRRREDPTRLKRAMIESGVPYQCGICGQLPKWQGKPLVIQIDHRNGINFDNRPSNVRFLCLHCHSQTGNFGTKGRKDLRQRVIALEIHTAEAYELEALGCPESFRWRAESLLAQADCCREMEGNDRFVRETLVGPPKAVPGKELFSVQALLAKELD